MSKHHLLATLSLGLLALLACGEEMGVEENPSLSTDKTSATILVANLDKEADASQITVTVPSGAQSVALVLDAGSHLVTAGTVTSPSGDKVFSFFEDVTTNRTDATDGVYTLLIPNNPEVTLEPGDWKVNFLTDAADGFEGEVDAVFKTSPASANSLDLNLYFVGVDGLDAATAQEDASFQSVLSNVEAVYGGAGIRFGQVNYLDVTGADADKYTVLNPDTELKQLFTLSGDRSGRSLSFFFVSDIEGDSGFTLLGLSGGVPGPPGIHGTTSSGVAVNMADFTDDPQSIEIIMAHEAGHYLGLYHTTEANGAALAPEGRQPIHGADHLSDTAHCADGSDADGNGILSASECSGADGGNLMFWSPANTSRALTSQQGTVMKTNPLIQ